jgi:hypothetical protein
LAKTIFAILWERVDLHEISLVRAEYVALSVAFATKLKNISTLTFDGAMPIEE